MDVKFIRFVLFFGILLCGFYSITFSQEIVDGDAAVKSEESPLILNPAGPDVVDREVPSHLVERELPPAPPASKLQSHPTEEIPTIEALNTSYLAEAIIEVYNEIVELDSRAFGFGDEAIDYPHAISIIVKELKRALYDLNYPEVVTDEETAIAIVKPNLASLAERIRSGLIKDPGIAARIADHLELALGL